MSIDLTGLDGKTVVALLKKGLDNYLTSLIVNLTPTNMDNQARDFLLAALTAHADELALLFQALINLASRQGVFGATPDGNIERACSQSELFDEINRLRAVA